MMSGEIALRFPLQKNCALFLRTAVSGAAAASGLPLDYVDDLREAVMEIFNVLLSETKRNDTMLLNFDATQKNCVSLRITIASRVGFPKAGRYPVTEAILRTLVNDVSLFCDEYGLTGGELSMNVAASCYGK